MEDISSEHGRVRPTGDVVNIYIHFGWLSQYWLARRMRRTSRSLDINFGAFLETRRIA